MERKSTNTQDLGICSPMLRAADIWSKLINSACGLAFP